MRAAVAILAATLLIAGCGGTGPTQGPAASVPRVTSPVVGVLVKIDAEGLTKVRGFTLRLADATELEFKIGVLENGAEFPPGHLVEHMSSSSPVRAFFRDVDGDRVVYRLEDGD